MEGASEEHDVLTGEARQPLHSQARRDQPNDLQGGRKSSRGIGLIKCGVRILLIGVLLFLFATAVRYKTLSDCQQNMEAELFDKNVLPLSSHSTEASQVTDFKSSQNNQDETQPESENLSPASMQAHTESESFNSLAKNQNQSPSFQSEYRKEGNHFNLWGMSNEQKIALFYKAGSDLSPDELGFSPFLRGKDEQTAAFFAEYENTSDVLDWESANITESADRMMRLGLKRQLGDRKKTNDQLLGKYNGKYGQKFGYMLNHENKGITYEQFLKTIELRKVTGHQIFKEEDPELDRLQQDEKELYQKEFQISKYQELPMCIVMPTYNNKAHLRYIWSLQSLLQQHYSNLKVIIIDDASKDKTAESTGVYLKWRNADPNKYILIASQQHHTALENIYYGVHKYCDYGQIFLIFDGDDELIGRQALKVINAQYQRHKYYVLYSQFISYNPNPHRTEILDIGISEDFPQFVQRSNSYRKFKHSYSQLRTMLSDLILLEPMSSLKLKSTGRFFEMLYDNALFYPAFEMACRNIAYLPQIFYWYNINTGVNDWYKAKTPFYKENRKGIELQRPFRCIEDQLRKVKLV